MNLSEKYDGLKIYGHCKIATAKLFNILPIAKMQLHKGCGWLSQLVLDLYNIYLFPFVSSMKITKQLLANQSRN